MNVGTHFYLDQSHPDEHYDDNAGENDLFGEQEQGIHIPSEGEWFNQCFQFQDHVISTLEYDSHREMLWAGCSDGRVSSFIPQEQMDDTEGKNSFWALQRYSSFRIGEEPVLQIIPHHDRLLCICAEKLSLHSIGGLHLSKLQRQHLSSSFFSCATPVIPSRVDSDPSHFVVGTSSSKAYAHDFSFSESSPLITYEVVSPSVCARSCGIFLLLGGEDGKIRLLDGRLRAQGVQHTIDGHAGSIVDLSVQPDGQYVVSCGLSIRRLNPYDQKSPGNVSCSI